MDNEKTFTQSIFSWLSVKFILWYMKKNNKKDISTDEENTCTLVIMDKEEYEEWIEFKKHCYIIYENEKELKDDFPNAVKKEEDN